MIPKLTLFIKTKFQMTDVPMDGTSPENQVIPYEAPWNIFAVSFSNNSHFPFRLGVASFLA